MYQQLYVVFLLLLSVVPVDPVLDQLLRCFSCAWNQDDSSRMHECRAGLDLEAGSKYLTLAQCAQCGKQELYKNGELVSLVRSCTLHHDMLKTDLLPVTGCTTQELRGASSVNCVCEKHLCNSALSPSVSNHLALPLCLLIFVAVQRR